MNIIRCIAIDDEPIALSVISRFCERLGNINLEVYSDPQIGLNAIMKKNPDVVLLDIEMNDINGISIAKKIGNQTVFIFTTAYLKYALDGFDLDAVDFLHKPFSFDRFRTAMDKALRRIQYKESRSHRTKNIVVKQEYANVSVLIDDIIYIEAMENYTKIYNKAGNCIISHNSMKNLMTLLPVNDFMRIHRSFIVPLSEITTFTRQSVKLSNGIVLPVGRQYVNELLGRLSPTKT